MQPAVAHLRLRGNTTTLNHATNDLIAFLQYANIHTHQTAPGELQLHLDYPLDATAQNELTFALQAWQRHWPDITIELSQRRN